MSQFNIYARKLDTAFKEARSEYNTAFRALQEAQQASRDANAWRPGDSAEEKQVRTARAALKLHDAEATFNEVSARVWDNFKATRRTIRAELEQAVRAANIANPDAIDNNALELMKTGVLSPADYLFLTDELHTFFRQLLNQIQKISRVAGKAADGLYNDGISPADILHHLLQLRTVGAFAAHPVNIDLIHAERSHQHLLPDGILLLCADADISDFQNASLLSLVNWCFP